MSTKGKIIIAAVALLLVALTVVGVVFIVRAKNENRFTINDTLPDGGGKRARVILLGGQSNASGCSRDDCLKLSSSAEKYAEYESGYENVYINYNAADDNLSNGFVKTSVRQGQILFEDGAYCFGPELGIAERISELYPDETVFIIKCAWGGTDLFEQWLSPSSEGKTGKLYKRFVAFVKQSVKYLESKNYDVSIEAMCWMQGESDSFTTDASERYGERLANFIADIRKEFKRYASEDGIAFIDAYIADNPMYWVYCDSVNACKDDVAALSPMNALVDTIGAGLSCSEEPASKPDVAHYDSQSQIKLGRMFADAAVQFFD